MRFSIAITSETYAVRMPETAIGIKALDAARQETGCKFDAKLLRSNIDHFLLNPLVRITEEVARESGHFDETSRITVECERGALNDFVERKLRLDRSNNGEIESARWEFEFNEEAWISAWKNRDYPLEWE